MTKVLFGDIVREVKEKVDRGNNPYEYFLAGEHFDSERLFIPRRGSFKGTDVGPAFIRKFKPGQVLYGSRRTYLKKVGVADFAGVTANTTFVLETRDDSVFRQKLLPFVILSEGFTDYSVGHSKGSTNPYVLFSDLSKYEINLPSIERQDSLVSLLCEAESLKERYRELLHACDDIVKSRFVEMFGDPVCNSKRLPIAKFEQLGKWQSGGTPSRANSEYFTGNIDWYSAGELNDYHLETSIEKITEDAIADSAAKLFPAGSLLVGMYDTAALKMGVLTKPSASNQACACLIPSYDCICVEWLYSAINVMKPHLLSQRKGCRQKNLSLKMIKEFEVPLPPLEEQTAFSTFFHQVDKSRSALQQALDDLNAMMAAILNEELSA